MILLNFDIPKKGLRLSGIAFERNVSYKNESIIKAKFMKLKVLIFIGILFMTFACNKDDENSQSEINGDYIGIFERNGNTSYVELNFKNGIYSGESDTVKFPAICKGNYSLATHSIQFENECVWTAEFDWTLILSENWNYSLQNNILILLKPNGDKYTLTKQ